MKPVLYDFKRGVLRRSVIAALAIFVLVGVGIAYSTAAAMASAPSLQQPLLYSYIDPGSGDFKLEALLLDPELRPVDGELRYKVGCYNETKLMESLPKGAYSYAEQVEALRKLVRVVDEGVARSSGGRVSVAKRVRDLVGLNLTCQLIVNVTTVYGTLTQTFEPFSTQVYDPVEVGNRTVYVVVRVPEPFYRTNIRLANGAIRLPSPLDISGGEVQQAPPWRGTTTAVIGSYTLVVGEALGYVSLSLHTVYTAKSERPLLLVSLHSPEDVELEVYLERSNATGVPEFLNVSDVGRYFERVGAVRSGVSLLELDVELLKRPGVPVRQFLRVVLLARSGSSTLYAATVQYVRALEAGLARRLVAAQISSGVGAGVFTAFFPVVALYLVYVYVAKPRAQGALEFVLARPITRLDLYVTRFSAGVLVVLASTALFYLALLLSIYYFTGVLLDLHSIALLYAGMVLSFLAYYSFFYLLSTLTAGTTYVVVSVVAYLVFSVLWQLLVALFTVSIGGFAVGVGEELTKALYTSYYFTPAGAYHFMQYYYQVQVGGRTVPAVEPVLNPWLVGVSISAWIAVPALLGWLVFRRANLSG